MSKDGLKTIGGVIGLAALAAGAFGINSAYGNMVFPKHRGVEYLEGRGYTDVTGGSRDYVNACAEDDTARSYTATHPETGERVRRTVCHNLIIGPHAPLLGMAY